MRLLYRKRAVPVIVILLYAIFFSCSENGKSIVVTTSMLESAASEVLPVSQRIDIVRLLSPSSCPGHFDLSPRIVPTLHSAVMVVRHDYQDVLEQKMESIGVKKCLSTENFNCWKPAYSVKLLRNG